MGRYGLAGLLITVGLTCGCQSTAAQPEETPAAAPPVKLGVLVVFDQMRGDFPVRWRSLFGTDGFRRVMDDGAWFSDCHCPYAWTFTAPGHASIGTGTTPSVHGIIGNDWVDRAGREFVPGAEEARYSRVPKLSTDLPPALYRGEDPGAGSPGRILAPGLGDAVKAATGGKGRVFSFSLKDRGAVLLAGGKADGCYWLDDRTGSFVTSTYYRDGLHPWVTRLNADRVADRWFNKPWERLRKDLDYEKHSGPDDVLGEDVGYQQGRTFPHPMTGGLAAPGMAYYRALTYSPFGNDLLLEAATRAIDAEKLGQGDSTDLLCLACSANDLIGHCWGPDSQEVLDVTLRSDRLLAELLAVLEKKVGKGRFFLVVASDHGVCPLLSVAKKQGKSVEPLPLALFRNRPLEFLNVTYGVPPAGRRYILATNDLNVYLDHSVIEKQGLKVDDVADKLAAWYREQPEVLTAYSAREQRDEKPKDRIGRMVQLSFQAKRSGDVAIVPKEYHPMAGWAGTNHGTPHRYDTHVTLMAYGPGLKAGERKDAASLLLAPVVLARGMGVAPPAKAAEKLPAGLFDGEK